MSLSPSPEITPTSYTSFDGEVFSYLRWNHTSTVNTVIIATHGINGAASDYANLAKYLQEKDPAIAVYAHNTRGQGLDPNEQRRGDIHSPKEWYKDLQTFSNLVRKKHPAAKIVWMGESMGSLITAHAVTAIEHAQKVSCDALILSSPVVSLGQELPPWKKFVVMLASSLAPTFRVSLEGLSNTEHVSVTKGTDHTTQAHTNSYHISKHSLRLLATLGSLIEGMINRVSHIHIPTLVVHGGKDFFSNPEDIKLLMDAFPQTVTTKQLYYPEAYHLLMYDELRETIFRDIYYWLNSFPKARND